MFVLLFLINALCLGVESGDSQVIRSITGSTTFLKRNFDVAAIEIAVCEQLKSRKKQYFYACDATGCSKAIMLHDADAKIHYDRLNKYTGKNNRRTKRK